MYFKQLPGLHGFISIKQNYAKEHYNNTLQFSAWCSDVLLECRVDLGVGFNNQPDHTRDLKNSSYCFSAYHNILDKLRSEYITHLHFIGHR